MGKKTLLLCCCIYLFVTNSQAQENLSVFGYWNYYENVPSVSLYKHISGKAFDQSNQRRLTVGKLKSVADWQKRKTVVRAKLQKAMGAFPDRTPLNPVVTGVIEQEDFIVEKLFFESRPGFFVTAAIFLPKKLNGKAPAILYCSGHSPNGFRSAVYQRVIINYVKKGFVVLAFDPVGQGERIQYPDKKLNPVDEHSFPGAQSFISGRPPVNYFVWDGIRAVDYLLTRKEVDPSRIGITGRSGGGTQTACIAAMDDRILAAAPECYITTFDKQLKSKGPQDAEQNLMYGLESGLDIADFLEVRAPKPALIVSTTNDIFSIQGARDVYAEAFGAYRVFNKADHIVLTEDDAAHASTTKNREAAYAFFQKFLNNPGDPADQDVTVFTDQELSTLPAGHQKGETLYTLNRKFTTSVIEKRAERGKPNAVDQAKLRSSIVSLTGFQKYSGKGDVIFSGRLHRAHYAIEKYLVKGSGDYYIPVLWLKPGGGADKAVLMFNETGKSRAAAPDGIADQLALKGIQVILADLSGIGELGPGYMKDGDSEMDGVPLNLWFTGILTRKSLVAVRAEEIIILADFVKKTGASSLRLSACASGTPTSDLLHVTALSNPFEKVALIKPLISYQSIVEEQYYKPKFAMSAVAASLMTYDLPDLVGLTGKNQLLLVNPVNAAEVEVSNEVCGLTYGDATPANSEGSSGIQVGIDEAQIPQMLLKWFK